MNNKRVAAALTTPPYKLRSFGDQQPFATTVLASQKLCPLPRGLEDGVLRKIEHRLHVVLFQLGVVLQRFRKHDLLVERVTLALVILMNNYRLKIAAYSLFESLLPTGKLLKPLLDANAYCGVLRQLPFPNIQNVLVQQYYVLRLTEATTPEEMTQREIVVTSKARYDSQLSPAGPVNNTTA